jgi:RNA polymerase sigma-70 factor, ECF subfamily
MAYLMTGTTKTAGTPEAETSRHVSFHGDAELARRAAEGDTGAFGLLVARYQRPMAALISRMTRRSDDVDDIVQELFLRAWRGLPRFRGESQFSTWLYRIAVNTAIKHKQKSKSELLQALPTEETGGGLEQLKASDETDPVAQAQRGERERLLREAVMRLPEKQRVVVQLHYFDGKSCEEISQIIGCSVGTVWSRLHYACKRLRSVLGESF